MNATIMIAGLWTPTVGRAPADDETQRRGEAVARRRRGDSDHGAGDEADRVCAQYPPRLTSASEGWDAP